MTIEKAVGQELRFCRTKKGLSQEKLGFEASLHRTYISIIERGLKSPTISTTVRFCGALEIAPDEFLKHVMQRVAGKRK
ncbi:MAG: helix-turn-helix domain-containing protein [Euryarchaeota archaeon]|jgi:transcriptional regulator with XRE-family HTH domain|nr:helix-turn-helix domain-containing protein [Euryarchaeota archaeon]